MIEAQLRQRSGYAGGRLGAVSEKRLKARRLEAGLPEWRVAGLPVEQS